MVQIQIQMAKNKIKKSGRWRDREEEIENRKKERGETRKPIKNFVLSLNLRGKIMLLRGHGGEAERRREAGRPAAYSPTPRLFGQ